MNSIFQIIRLIRAMRWFVPLSGGQFALAPVPVVVRQKRIRRTRR